MAKRAQVSRATVSYVLNDVTNQTISPATREAVLRAAKELDYRPNQSARSLASGQSTSLICVVPRTHLVEPALSLLGDLTTELGQRGFSLAVHFQSSSPDALTELAKALRPRLIFPLMAGITPADPPVGAVMTR